MSSSYTGPILDVDVHHRLPDDAGIIDYLPERWHAFVRDSGPGRFQVAPPYGDGVLMTGSAKRDDAIPAGGGPQGSDYDTLRQQLLEPHGQYRALLTHQLGEFGGHFNQYFSRDLARAMNDWTVDTWLTRDERLYSGIVIPLAEPDQAAMEIRRMADHPHMIAVLLAGNVLGRPLGDPLFHPIYQAAAERGLPIVVHISLVARPNAGSVAAGGRLTFLPAITQVSQQAMHNISSLLVHGVFERFPNLRFLFNEYGVGWLPFAMARLDDAYPLLKAETPWLKQRPSDYLRRHVRLATQPLEEDFGNRSALFDLLGTIDGVADMLCYSSDYPHGTMDEPLYVARRLPAAWRDKVMNANSAELFGLPVAPAPTSVVA